MARMLEEFPETIERQDGKYPWSDWANGQPWELEQGVDFNTKVTSFRQTCAKVAQRRGQESPRTAIRREGDKTFLIVQFKTEQPGRRRTTRTK